MTYEPTPFVSMGVSKVVKSRGIPDTLTLILPEPPSFNEMIGYAKLRTRKLPSGGWAKRAIPVVYDTHLKAYELQCLAALRGRGIEPPAAPWAQWALVSAHFQLHSLRDPTELLASLKWPVDTLVRLGYVANDSPRELLSIPIPTQTIDRANRRITLVIAHSCSPAAIAETRG